jgi:hypothetical protein
MELLQGVFIAIGLLVVAVLILRALFGSTRYRARCRDCPYTYGSSHIGTVKAAALFHNLHSREKGQGHRLVIEEKS